MRRKLGGIVMIIGAALVFAALFLFLRNQNEDAQAGKAVEEILPQVVEEIQEALEEDSVYPDPYTTEMTEVEIDGYTYIGYLAIPALDLELPVMSEWSYSQLKISPCRYTGSTKTDDLVIAAHNYTRHFGRIKKLSPGDAVYFTDMDGVALVYRVVELDTVSPADMQEMTDSGFDLTLFTCTYSGQNRVAVRCDRAETLALSDAGFITMLCLK